MNRALLTFALVFSGVLAGSSIDRAIVAMPAWQIVGATAWADFSRHAEWSLSAICFRDINAAHRLWSVAPSVDTHV